MSTVSKENVAHLAALARLDLTDEEAERFAGQLSNVVGYVEQLQEVGTDDEDQGTGVTGLTNILQADEPRAADDPAVINRDAFFAQAPRTKETLLQVRAVLGGEESA